MRLMQKHAKDDGAVDIDNLDRWQSHLAIIELLSATMSAGSFEKLKRVCRPFFDIESCLLVPSSVS